MSTTIKAGSTVERIFTTKPLKTGGMSGTVVSVKNGLARVQWASGSTALHPVNALVVIQRAATKGCGGCGTCPRCLASQARAEARHQD